MVDARKATAPAAEPFLVAIPDAELVRLKTRLAETRWPSMDRADWSFGVPRTYLETLVDHWRASFSWRRVEERLNTYPQYRVKLDGQTVHFIHLRSPEPDSLPLLLTHGWPSSILEFLDLGERLATPAHLGGGNNDAFDVVIPSLPGFGFSTGPVSQGATLRVHRLWHRLMTDVLGYPRYGAHGGDIGASVTIDLAVTYPDDLVGIHLTTDWSDRTPHARPMTEEEARFFLVDDPTWRAEEGGYSHMQRTKPLTLAYGLTDSPIGLAAWILEKFRAWTGAGMRAERFDWDRALATVSLYWFTKTTFSSFMPYFESKHAGGESTPYVAVPTGVSRPSEYRPAPRSNAVRNFHLVYWSELDGIGHFPALEAPDRLATELREFFRPLRAR